MLTSGSSTYSLLIFSHFRVLILPGELASEAWNTEKLIKAYDAKKKLEMMGAITFSWAVRKKKSNSQLGTEQNLQFHDLQSSQKTW